MDANMFYGIGKALVITACLIALFFFAIGAWVF